MPGGFVCSGSMRTAGPLEVREILLGNKPIKKVFSKEQRAFFAEHAPDGMDINDLSVLGPITVFKLKWKPADFARKIVGELWNYPDGSRILELSTKCPPAEAFQVAAEAKAFLANKGIDTTGEQATKTRTALEFFAKELKSLRVNRRSEPERRLDDLSGVERLVVREPVTGEEHADGQSVDEACGNTRRRQPEQVGGRHAPHHLDRLRRVVEVPPVLEGQLRPRGCQHEVGVDEPRGPFAHERLTGHEHLGVGAEVERLERVEERGRGTCSRLLP